MPIQDFIAQLESQDNQKAYQAFRELLAESEKNDQVYPYFDRFIKMMRHQSNSFIRTRGLRLIAFNARWDREGRVDRILAEYLEHLEDEKPITARQCIRDTVLIAQYKPELGPRILEALGAMGKTYQDSMQPLVCQDRKKAMRQIQQLSE